MSKLYVLSLIALLFSSPARAAEPIVVEGELAEILFLLGRDFQDAAGDSVEKVSYLAACYFRIDPQEMKIERLFCITADGSLRDGREKDLLSTTLLERFPLQLADDGHVAGGEYTCTRSVRADNGFRYTCTFPQI